MNEERLAALEETLSHQSLALEQLDEVVRSQWSEIERLRREIARLEERVESAADEPSNDPLPPHY